MIKVYDIIKDKNNELKLTIQQIIDDVDNIDIPMEDIINIMNDYFNMCDLAYEKSYIIGFNDDMEVNGLYLVSSGTYDTCYFYKRNIFTFLLLTNSTKMVMIHNHPSGNLKPSDNDISCTNQIRSLANDLGIQLVNSIIISNKGYQFI